MTSRRIRHGTTTRWVRYKCRCPRCEVAWQRYRDRMYTHRDPTGFGPPAQDRFLGLVRDGSTLKTAAAQCGVSSSTISLLARSRPRFRADLDAALDDSRRQRHQGPRPSTRRRARSDPTAWATAAGYDSPEAAIRATAALTLDDAAQQLGISYATVFSHRAAAGVPTSSHRPRRAQGSFRHRAAVAGYDSPEAAIRATAYLTVNGAARKLGVTTYTIYDWRKRLGLVKASWWSAAGYESAEAAIRGTAHLSVREASARLGITQSPLYRWRKRLGLTTPSKPAAESSATAKIRRSTVG